MKVLSQGSVVEHTTEIVPKNGIKTPVIGRCVAFRDKSRNIKGIFATARIIEPSSEDKPDEKPHMIQKEKHRKPPPG